MLARRHLTAAGLAGMDGTAGQRELMLLYVCIMSSSRPEEYYDYISASLNHRVFETGPTSYAHHRTHAAMSTNLFFSRIFSTGYGILTVITCYIVIVFFDLFQQGSSARLRSYRFSTLKLVDW